MSMEPTQWPTILDEIVSRSRAECWIYPGGKPTEYPKVNLRGSIRRLARTVLEAELERPIASGMLVCHTCDQRRCYNPDHLYEGTQTQNMNDCRIRGRLASGLHHPLTKLSESDVVLIRRDQRPSTTLAAELGVSAAYVHSVRWRKARTEVPEESSSLG
jgi:hypothetical protein